MSYYTLNLVFLCEPFVRSRTSLRRLTYRDPWERIFLVSFELQAYNPTNDPTKRTAGCCILRCTAANAAQPVLHIGEIEKYETANDYR